MSVLIFLVLFVIYLALAGVVNYLTELLPTPGSNGKSSD